MQDHFHLFYRWREAERLASAAESALQQAALLALRDQQPAPSKEDRERALQLRSRARELFRAAMREVGLLNARAEALTSPPPLGKPQRVSLKRPP